jgi:hypothetical protein
MPDIPDIAIWKLQTEFEVIDAALWATLSAGPLLPRYEFKRDSLPPNAIARYSLILAYLEEPEEHENTWAIGSIRIEVVIRKLGKALAELKVSDFTFYNMPEDSHAGETWELEQWQKMRNHAVEYIIEGLKRDDAWHPQVTEPGQREESQPAETNTSDEQRSDSQDEPPDPDVAGWDACLAWYYSVGRRKRMTLKEFSAKIHKSYGYVRQRASGYKAEHDLTSTA